MTFDVALGPFVPTALTATWYARFCARYLTTIIGAPLLGSLSHDLPALSEVLIRHDRYGGSGDRTDAYDE